MGNLSRRYRTIKPVGTEPDPASAPVIKLDPKPEPKAAPKESQRSLEQESCPGER
jgi:hypothetical protein